MPLTEEVAADIFTGTFTAKWADAAAAASSLLDGTLYARYYDLPAPQAWPGRGITAKVTTQWGKTTAEDFAALCASRARQAHTSGGRQPGRGERDRPGAEPGPHHPQPRDPHRRARPARPGRGPGTRTRRPGVRLAHPQAAAAASQPGGPSSRRSRTRPTPGGRPSTSSACARRTPRPGPWPGCAARSRPPVMRTSRPGSARGRRAGARHRWRPLRRRRQRARPGRRPPVPGLDRRPALDPRSGHPQPRHPARGHVAKRPAGDQGRPGA